MLLVTVLRGVLTVPLPPASRPGLLGALTYLILFTGLGGAVVGACYWPLDTALLRRFALLRWLLGSVCVAAYLITLSLASTHPNFAALRATLVKPGFLISTLVVSLLFGWVLGMGLFSKAGTTERIYLAPAEFAALSPAAQASLHPDGSESTVNRAV